MNSFPLTIITPHGRIFNDRVNSLIATGVSGAFGILANHAPMVISLKRGPLKLYKDGQESFYAVNSGILEVNRNREVLLLADSVSKAETYEQAKTATQSPKGK